MARDKPRLDKLLGIIFGLTRPFGAAKKLAEFLGVFPQHVNSWFTGRSKPTGEMTLRLLEWAITQKLKEGSDLEEILGLLMKTSDPGKLGSPKPIKKRHMQRRKKITRSIASVANRVSSVESKALLDERRRKIVEMREQGFRFRQIGSAVGVTAAYAQMLYSEALKRMSRAVNETFGALSQRARNCLIREGFQTKDEVIAALRRGSLHPKLQGRYGHKTHAEVCHWAGVSDVQPL